MYSAAGLCDKMGDRFTLFEALFGATPVEIFAGLRVVDGHGE
jgi:hypothetical protein